MEIRLRVEHKDEPGAEKLTERKKREQRAGILDKTDDEQAQHQGRRENKNGKRVREVHF